MCKKRCVRQIEQPLFHKVCSGVLSEATHSPCHLRLAVEGPVEHSKSACQAQGSPACPDRRAGSAETVTTEPASAVSNSSPLLLTSLLGLLPAIASSLFHNPQSLSCYAMLCYAMLCYALLFLSLHGNRCPYPHAHAHAGNPPLASGFVSLSTPLLSRSPTPDYSLTSYLHLLNLNSTTGTPMWEYAGLVAVPSNTRCLLLVPPARSLTLK
jgi:hypothetical protein